MPSEPDSGPTMMSTLSCSTSLRVALTATSGLASDDALMTSIFLPATVPPRCLTARSAPRMPSWPPAANGPSRVASRPILTTGAWAVAPPATTTASTTAATAVNNSRLSSDFIVSSSWVCAAQGPRWWTPLSTSRPRPAGQPGRLEPRVQISASASPPAEQPIGREQHDDEEHGADQQVEPLPADQIDREVLDQHEHDRAHERPDRMPHASEHRDDQDVDEPARADRARRDQPVVPDHQHAADRRD